MSMMMMCHCFATPVSLVQKLLASHNPKGIIIIINIFIHSVIRKELYKILSVYRQSCRNVVVSESGGSSQAVYRRGHNTSEDENILYKDSEINLDFCEKCYGICLS